MPDSAAQTAVSLEQLKASLQTLSLQAQTPVDPLRYYYLRALLEKLEGRAHYSDVQFQCSLLKAKRLLTEYPDHYQQDGSVEAHQTKGSAGLSALKALNTQLQNRIETASVNIGSGSRTPKATPSSSSDNKVELQAVKHYQQLFEKMSVERLLNQVMQEIPENAGPLNPERMVIRCLSALQDISPVYAMRLIGYYEALICLQSLPLSDK